MWSLAVVNFSLSNSCAASVSDFPSGLGRDLGQRLDVGAISGGTCPAQDRPAPSAGLRRRTRRCRRTAPGSGQADARVGQATAGSRCCSPGCRRLVRSAGDRFKSESLGRSRSVGNSVGSAVSSVGRSLEHRSAPVGTDDRWSRRSARSVVDARRSAAAAGSTCAEPLTDEPHAATARMVAAARARAAVMVERVLMCSLLRTQPDGQSGS